MESIGSRIRAAREAKGISINHAQNDTRISARILSAIEADRAQEFISGPVYVRSFIKKYADYLGLDGRSLAEDFTGKKPEFKEQISVLSNNDKIPVKKIIYAVVAIAIIFLGIKLIALAGSKTIAFFKSRPKAEKTATVKARPAVILPQRDRPTVILPAPTMQIPKGEALALSLKARSDVYLKVRSDGNVIYDGILKKGSSERWEAKQSFEISTSKAEALAIDLNGASLGPLGKGAVKDLKLPRSREVGTR